MNKNYTILHRPLTRKQVQRQWKRHRNLVEGVIAVELGEVIERGIEGFDDLIAERLIDSVLLTGIGWEVVGHHGNTLHLKVSGDPAEYLVALNDN